MKNRFYKTSSHGGCGSTVMFWGINGSGYVTNIDEAHIYTRDEIQKDASNGCFSWKMVPLSSDHVDALATWRVDCQYISEDDHYPKKKDPNDEYVAFKKYYWDGNDLAFATMLGNTFDYPYASIFTENDMITKGRSTNAWVFVPKYITDQIARRTFQEININRRKMIQGAGIIGVRKQRESISCGKTRWNCPTCGKIHWQFNPYDFDGCDDWKCNDYNPNKWDDCE